MMSAYAVKQFVTEITYDISVGYIYPEWECSLGYSGGMLSITIFCEDSLVPLLL